MGANKALAGIPLLTLSLKTGNFFYKTCKIYVLFTQRSFDISRQNLHICKFAVMHYQLLWPNCCKTSTFGDIKAITCDNACRGHYGTSGWPRSMHEPSTHCDYSSMKRWSPAVRASRIYSNQRCVVRDLTTHLCSNQALTPSWRRLTTENWNIFIKKKWIWKCSLQNDNLNQRIHDNPISLQTHFV